MENTIIIAIVSFLCILAHVPTLILRIVPFHEKISDKDRIRLTVIYAIGLAVDFGICMWVGNYREIDVPFYKINLIAFCIVMAAVNIWLVPGYTKVHLFVFGIVADIVMIALSIGAYVSSLLGMQGNAIGIAETSAIAIVVYALLYPLLSSLLRYTVTPFLEIECQNYWETLVGIDLEHIGQKVKNVGARNRFSADILADMAFPKLHTAPLGRSDQIDLLELFRLHG